MMRPRSLLSKPSLTLGNTTANYTHPNRATGHGQDFYQTVRPIHSLEHGC
uniref:Uncharacterized protein n=1 Tax=Anguilla anguilla TaxID=7936 RepID=A0A0E9PWQ2_ANGAN